MSILQQTLSWMIFATDDVYDQCCTQLEAWLQNN